MDKQARRLYVFARAPVLGEVKTRLASSKAEALAAHLDLLERTLTQVASSPSYTTELWLAGRSLENSSNQSYSQSFSTRYGVAVRSQLGSDLGERMRLALLDGIRQNSHSVLIGSDCPDIDRSYVEAAFAALAHAELVVGPAEDGGYGLIGCTRDMPSLFDGLEWGTDGVLQETLARAEALGIHAELLDPIWDVDSAGDWARYLQQMVDD